METVKTKRTIGNKIVKVEGKIADIEFMVNEDYDAENFTLYLVLNEKVIGTIDIECGMGQGIGFVDEMTFNNAK